MTPKQNEDEVKEALKFFGQTKTKSKKPLNFLDEQCLRPAKKGKRRQLYHILPNATNSSKLRLYIFTIYKFPTNLYCHSVRIIQATVYCNIFNLLARFILPVSPQNILYGSFILIWAKIYTNIHVLSVCDMIDVPA